MIRARHTLFHDTGEAVDRPAVFADMKTVLFQLGGIDANMDSPAPCTTPPPDFLPEVDEWVATAESDSADVRSKYPVLKRNRSSIALADMAVAGMSSERGSGGGGGGGFPAAVQVTMNYDHRHHTGDTRAAKIGAVWLF